MRIRLHRVVPLVAIIAFQAAAGPAPSDADLSVSAIEGYVRTADASDRASRLRAAREVLRARATESPDLESSAAVFFGRGLTPTEIEGLVNDRGLEIASAELKAVAGVDGRVFTIFLGSRDLLILPGSVGERLKFAVGHYRAEFLQLSKVAPADEAARYRDLAFNPSIRCYRVDVIGKIRSIEELSDDSNVAAAFLQESVDLIAGYRAIKQMYEDRHASGLGVMKGPPPQEGAPLRGYTVVPPPSAKPSAPNPKP